MRGLVIALLIFIPFLSGRDASIPERRTRLQEPLATNVTLTTYMASNDQTDSTPLLTASGFKISSAKTARKHKIIAVSRDLKKRLKWGDAVRISNAGKYDGVYYVHDLMNKRFRNKIDILINVGDKTTKLKNIIIHAHETSIP